MTNSKTLLIVTDGIPNSEYKTIKNSFYLNKKWNIVSLRYSDLVKLSDNFQHDSSLISSLSDSFNSFMFEKNNYHGEYNFIYPNKFLDFQFKGIEEELTNSIILSETFSKYIALLNPEVIIFGHDAFTKERILVEVAKEKGITTIGLLHSGLGFKYGYRGIVGDVDYVLVWNKIDKEFIKGFGISENRIIIIGSLTYDIPYQKYLKVVKTKICDNRKNNTVLILTAAINSGFSAPIASQSAHLETIFQLIDLIKRRQDLFFIIKPHPSYDHYEIYRQIRNMNFKNFVFDENLTLSQAISEAKVCVLLNYFTTAAIDAILNFKPVLFLDNAIYPMSNWETNDKQNHIKKINNFFDVEKNIDLLLYNIKFKTHILESGKLLLHNILGESKNSAIKNLEIFLETTLTNNIKKLKENFADTFFLDPIFRPNKLGEDLNCLPINFFVSGALNISCNKLFNNKIFRLNKSNNNFNSPLLLKNYIYGNNTCNSKINFASLLFLLKLSIFNFDLIFKKSYFKNREVQKFIYRHLIKI